MYHTHFGLERRLFGDGIATDADVFRSPKHDQIRAHFKLALSTPSSAVVLRGPAGVGKTTLTSAALRATSTRLAVAWLNCTPANAAELLELVLVELGISTIGTTRIDRLQLWRQFQAEARATETRLFVVVERTEDFPPEVLHALDALTAADAIGNLGANLVLLGHRTIDEHLAPFVLESLRQRIRLRADLAPFTEAELQDYLRHQVACAGGHYDHVFAPGTVAALHRLTGGVARLANSLCETALDLAALQEQKLLTADLVGKTAVSLLGLADSAPAARVTPIVASPPAPAVAPSVSVAAMPAAAAASAPPPPSAVIPAPAPTPAAAAPPVPVAATAPAPVAPSPMSNDVPSVTAALTAPVTAEVPAPVPPSVVATPAPAAPTVVEFEFDGEATDITDVAMADFPVLTDAVEAPAAATPAKRVTPAAQPSQSPAPAPATTPPVRASAPQPVGTPAPATRSTSPSRLETAYAAPKAAPAAKSAAAAPAPKPTAAPAAAPRIAAVDSDDDDLLRQTQTMRAIAVAKSIDDISSSMAETLFGDGDFDLVSAALASAAADWPDDEEQPATAPAAPPAPAPAASKPEPVKTAELDEDPFDFLGLGDDAPLELIDDSAQAPAEGDRRRATR